MWHDSGVMGSLFTQEAQGMSPQGDDLDLDKVRKEHGGGLESVWGSSNSHREALQTLR